MGIPHSSLPLTRVGNLEEVPLKGWTNPGLIPEIRLIRQTDLHAEKSKAGKESKADLRKEEDKLPYFTKRS